jgi:hypothetical protein
MNWLFQPLTGWVAHPSPVTLTCSACLIPRGAGVAQRRVGKIDTLAFSRQHIEDGR